MTESGCGKLRGKLCGEGPACAVKIELWAVAVSLALSFIKALVGILGRSEALVADGLYSFYMSFNCGRSVLTGGDEERGFHDVKALWFMSLVAGFIVAAGALDVLVFSLWRLVRSTRGALVEPSPYVLLVAAGSILSNHLMTHYSSCVSQQPGGRHVAELRSGFRLSMAYSGLVFAGVAIGQWWPAADAVAAIFGAALLVRPVQSLCSRPGETPGAGARRQPV